jgi:hypothetical protein
LGSRIGVSGIKFNRMLMNAGLQTKDFGRWVPTKNGGDYCRIFDTGKKHSDGVLVEQVKWFSSVLDVVKPNARQAD